MNSFNSSVNGKIILHLDRLMVERKISLNELAEKVGISNANLSKIKNNHMEMMLIIARFMELLELSERLAYGKTACGVCIIGRKLCYYDDLNGIYVAGWNSGWCTCICSLNLNSHSVLWCQKNHSLANTIPLMSSASAYGLRDTALLMFCAIICGNRGY